MNNIAKQASKIAQAMYNAAKNPDQYQNQPPNQQNQYPQQQNPYQQPGQQVYGQQPAHQNSSYSNEPVYSEVVPPSAYGNSSYHGPTPPQAQTPSSYGQPIGALPSTTPVNASSSPYNAAASPYSSQYSHAPAQTWSASSNSSQTHINPETYTPTGTYGTSNPYSASLPPPPPLLHSTGFGTPGLYASASSPSTHNATQLSPVGQETGVLASAQQHAPNPYGTPHPYATPHPTGPPPAATQENGAAGSRPGPPAHAHSFPSPMGTPTVPQPQSSMNYPNNPNTYPPYNPSNYDQGTPTSLLNNGVASPPSHPTSSHPTPSQEHNSFVAELPGNMPIELPAELPADLKSINKPTESGAQLPSLQYSTPYSNAYPPPLNFASHPNAYPQASNQGPSISPGPQSPPPLMTTSANIPTENLVQPKPVHPEHTPAATAQQIANITPLSPPLPHSAPPSHQQLPPPPPMPYPQPYATMPPLPPAPYGAAQQPPGLPPAASFQPSLSYNPFASQISQSQPQFYSHPSQPMYPPHPPGPPPPSAYSNHQQPPYPTSSTQPPYPQANPQNDAQFH